MSGGGAKSRGKARARQRGLVRQITEPAAAGEEAATTEVESSGPVPRPFEGRGAVPGQRATPVALLAEAIREGFHEGRHADSSAAHQIIDESGAPAEPSKRPALRLAVAVDLPPHAAPPVPLSGGDGFARGYPAPADAVRCAMLGSPPTFWFEGDTGRLTVAVESGRLVASGVAHVGEDLAQLVAAVLLNHDGDAADAVEPVRAALAALAVEVGQVEPEVTVDLSGPSPRIGWLSHFDPAPWVTWHDFWAAFHVSAAGTTAAAVVGAGDSGEYDDCFRRQGLRVERCAEPGCRAPLTDRHPAWPGQWSAASGSGGPVCAVPAAVQAWPAGLLTAAPHRIAER